MCVCVCVCVCVHACVHMCVSVSDVLSKFKGLDSVTNSLIFLSPLEDVLREGGKEIRISLKPSLNHIFLLNANSGM